MNLSADQIRWILIRVFVLVISVAFHEFGHAFMATKMGDDTPRRQGRVTLNPLAHIDILGTLILPIAGGVYGAASGRGGGFGWGKPVQWNPARIKRGRKMSTATILVSLAGPGMNFVLATLLCLTHVVLLWRGAIDPAADVSQILTFAVITNFVLMFFNLLPAPPLDGGHVLESLMPYKYRAQFEAYAKFGPFVVIAVAMIPQLAKIFLIPAQFCAAHLYKLVFAIFGLG